MISLDAFFNAVMIILRH